MIATLGLLCFDFFDDNLLTVWISNSSWPPKRIDTFHRCNDGNQLIRWTLHYCYYTFATLDRTIYEFGPMVFQDLFLSCTFASASCDPMLDYFPAHRSDILRRTHCAKGALSQTIFSIERRWMNNEQRHVEERPTESWINHIKVLNLHSCCRILNSSKERFEEDVFSSLLIHFLDVKISDGLKRSQNFHGIRSHRDAVQNRNTHSYLDE